MSITLSADELRELTGYAQRHETQNHKQDRQASTGAVFRPMRGNDRALDARRLARVLGCSFPRPQLPVDKERNRR